MHSYKFFFIHDKAKRKHKKKYKHFTSSFVVVYLLYIYLCKFVQRTKVDPVEVIKNATLTTGGILERSIN